MKNALKITGVLFLLVFAAGFFYPATNDFEKSIVIFAPSSKIFPLINDLKNWPKWSPWIKAEPDMEITYGEVTAGEGAEYSWHGESMGDGKLWITESLPNRRVVTNIDFGGGDPSQGILNLEVRDGATMVTWRFINKNGWNPISRLVGGIFIEPMVKDSYEEGLAYLKEAAEYPM